MNEDYGDLPWLGVADDFSYWHAELMDEAPSCPECYHPSEPVMAHALFTTLRCYVCRATFLLPTSEVM